MEKSESDQDERDDDRRVTMDARAERAEDVAAVELRGGDEVERRGEESDPGGTADGMKKDVANRSVWVEERGESAEDQRSAEDGARVRGIGEAGYDFCVKHAEDERGDGDDEADDRAGCADVEEGAARPDRRANHDESAEGADQRRERDEERVGGMNVVMTAGEVVAEFVDEQDGQQSDGEGEASDERERMFVEKCQRIYEFVEIDGFIFGVGGGKVGTGY